MLCLSWYDSLVLFLLQGKRNVQYYNIFHILFWYTEYDRPRNIVTDISYSTITDDMIYYLFHHFPPSIYDGGKIKIKITVCYISQIFSPYPSKTIGL